MEPFVLSKLKNNCKIVIVVKLRRGRATFLWTGQTTLETSDLRLESGDVLTGTDDDGCGLVVDGHGPVVGRDREPAAHLVEAPVHHGSVVGINLDSLPQHFQRQSLCTFRLMEMTSVTDSSGEVPHSLGRDRTKN